MSARYPFEIRQSPIQGEGAFATERIPAGTRLIEYAGQRLTPAQADARYPDGSDERHHTYLFAIDDDIVIDAAVDGNEARFINHSSIRTATRSSTTHGFGSRRSATSSRAKSWRTTMRTC